MPIRTRLTLVSAVLMSLLLVGLSAFLYVQLRAKLFETVDLGLRSRADAIAQGLGSKPLHAGQSVSDPEDAFVQLVSPEGQIVDSSSGLRPLPLLPSGDVERLTEPAFFDAEVSTVEEPVPGRLLAIPLQDGSTLIVGVTVEDQNEALRRLLGLLLIGGSVALAVASVMAWLLARSALRPVERLRVEADDISGADASKRLPVSATGDEVARLGESLNHMLGRIEESLERERRFVDDASHELRTPLANLTAELDLALRRTRTPAELVASLRSAAEETDRLSRLAQDLLVLARAQDGRSSVRREQCDLAKLVGDTVDSFSSRAADLNVRLRRSVRPGVRVTVDPVRIRQAVENVLDNALRHTPGAGEVMVSVTGNETMTAVEVRDSGDGFPEDFLPYAFEPFSRADTARGREHGGTGLGLAIVRAVAVSHGGSATAVNHPGGGAVVTVHVPPASHS
ncbi:MAG: ATP-binding protein [Nocardioidaceae bacterium]